LANLGEFIGQDLDYERIERVGIGSVSRPNSSFSKESSDFRPVARWRKGIDEVQLRDLEFLIGGTLQSLGYERAAANMEALPARLRRMRGLYRWYFDTKYKLKTETPLGQVFASPDLELVSATPEGATSTPNQMREPVKILQIGNYPPPMCGWAIQLKLVTEELRRRGDVCDVPCGYTANKIHRQVSFGSASRRKNCQPRSSS
jgi:hypothetical protein